MALIMESPDDRFELKTNQMTINDEEFVIVPTPTGLWRVEVKGTTNMRHSICKQTYTSLIFARRDLQKYAYDNRSRLDARQKGKAARAAYEAEQNVNATI
jgi:hypothetical protein